MEQVNVKTKEPYQGGNQLTLQGYDYESNKWGTFLTWKELGYSIIKGESGVSCFRITPKKFTKRNGEESVVKVKKYFTLFNEEQVKPYEFN